MTEPRQLIFGDPISIKESHSIPKIGYGNPCIAVYGDGPPGAKCKTCELLYRQSGTAKTYYKCELRRNTRGPGTDHRVNWPACGKYRGDI